MNKTFLKNQIFKIKNYFQNNTKLFAAIALILILAGAAQIQEDRLSLSQPEPQSSGQASSSITLASQNNVDVAKLSQIGDYSGLPVSKVDYFPVDNAQGTAILLPQFHRDPTTTSTQDPLNDNAQANQEQTLPILRALDQNGVSLIMVEGDLAGPVPQDKIDSLKTEIAARDKFETDWKNFKGQLQGSSLNPSVVSSLQASMDQQASAVDRDIIVKYGAPYVLKAEGSDSILVGAEDQATLDKCTDIIRNYVYLQDRLNQVQQGQQPASMPSASIGAANPNIQSLIQQLMGSTNTPAAQLAALQYQVNQKGDTSLSQSLQGLEQDLSNVQNSMQAATAAAVSSSAGSSTAPSRANNPYSNISDPAVLQNMLNQSQQDINQWVIGERNKEAAQNFAQALKTYGKSVGAIQFGAGHEDGLVSELNKQNLNVIVITTNEVASQPNPVV
ncbi:MAG: hypothetical protein M1383_02250 [Patescibacteria group bacterium]|nr:hypothetical protein [Patescibacteria group bacterium]